MPSWNTLYSCTILSGVRCTSCFEPAVTEPHSDLEPLTVVCSIPAASGPRMVVGITPSSSTENEYQWENVRGVLVF